MSEPETTTGTARSGVPLKRLVGREIARVREYNVASHPKSRPSWLVEVWNGKSWEPGRTTVQGTLVPLLYHHNERDKAEECALWICNNPEAAGVSALNK